MSMSRIRIWSLVFISLLEISLFGGIYFGWSSILFILKAEGLYEELCYNNTDSQDMTNLSTSKPADEVNACFSQDEQFNLLYSIAMTLILILGVIVGEMQYKVGVKQTRALSVLIFVAGALMLGFASVNIPWLVSPGLVFTGVAGISLLISNMQIAALLGKRYSIYIGILNGLYDSSVLTQRIVKKLFEDGIDRLYSYSGMAFLAVIISGTCTILFPSMSQISSNENEQDGNNDVELPKRNLPKNEKVEDLNSILSEGRIRTDEQEFRQDDTDKIRSIILCKKFLLHIVWMSGLSLRLFYYVGSINRVMEQKFKDNDLVSYYTDVLAYTLMGGIISSYFAGQSMHLLQKFFTDRIVTAISLMITSGLAVLLSCLAFVVTKESLYISFVTVTAFRSYLFTMHMQFFMNFFPPKYRSLLYCLVITVSGVIVLIQYALFVWTDENEDANTYVNAVLLTLTLLSLIHPINLFLEKDKGKHISKL